jgi:hypothetical protein
VVSRGLLARLWAAGAGPADLGAPLTIDVDSTIVEVTGRHKQGAAVGYPKTRGYHPQPPTCAQTGQALMSRLRGGAAGAARGAASFLTETVSRVRDAGATGQLTRAEVVGQGGGGVGMAEPVGYVPDGEAGVPWQGAGRCCAGCTGPSWLQVRAVDAWSCRDGPVPVCRSGVMVSG